MAICRGVGVDERLYCEAPKWNEKMYYCRSRLCLKPEADLSFPTC